MTEEIKKKHRNPDDIKALTNRLSRIEGQIRGIKKMLEEDAYCIDIITQTAAASSALNSFSREILYAHLETCVYNSIKNGDEDIIPELKEVINKLLK